MNIKTFLFNMVRENTYVVWDEHTLEAAVIDCGAFTEKECAELDQFIVDNHLTLTHNLVTHAHFDHTFGTGHIFERYGLKAEVSRGDEQTYRQIPSQTMMFIGLNVECRIAPVGKLLDEGDKIEIGQDILLRVLSTPGHTPGGISYYCEKSKVLFSGDALFLESIGRTDFPGGDARLLVDSLCKNVMTLPEDVEVLPGHGHRTTVEHEKRYNPYLS